MKKFKPGDRVFFTPKFPSTVKECLYKKATIVEVENSSWVRLTFDLYPSFYLSGQTISCLKEQLELQSWKLELCVD